MTPGRAAVVYRSHSGVTRRYAEEIAGHLRGCGVDTTVASVGECDTRSLAEVDLLLLGCWTSGLFVIRQHPDQPWVAFAREIPALPHARVALFTTYRLATGGMFRRMQAELPPGVPEPALTLRSRDGRLSEADGTALDRFVAGVAAT